MTIKDIARESGFAVGTVSRVLNNQDYVSSDTREKILSVVNKYGFVLNKNAKELKAHQSKSIVIIEKGISNILLNSILEIIQSGMEKFPYTLNVTILDEDENEAEKAYNIFCEKKPLGMIFLGGNPEKFSGVFSNITIPCVLVSTKSLDENFRNLSSVSTDSFQASLCIAKNFVKNGHKKIGIIGGNLENSEMSKNRYEGFLEGLELSGLEFDFEKSYVTARYSFEGGAAAAEELLKKFPDVTAIFAMSDIMAIGAVRKLKDLGYSVPGDISVAGFDGLSLSEFYSPRITTIRQNLEDLAVQGLKALIDSIEKKSDAVHKMIPFEFVEGESVRKI
jgi:LacI family transcriptional regulator